MSRTALLSASLLLLSACSSSWDPVDHDGDGFSALAGDCWDAVEGPEGTDLTGDAIFPGATETFYDAIDQDCAGDDDFDADGDGYVPTEHYGATTVGVPESGQLPGGDCWDDPGSSPAEFTVVGSDLTDKQGNQLDWVQPEADEVNPAADDAWYDGVDQDCAGDDDFDKDDDGFRTESYPDQSGAYGDDCVDGNDLDDENFAGDAAVDINPDATEQWYDGTDQDCDDNDCDQDYDGFDGGDGVYCVPNECDDEDAEIYPDPDIPEVWYNGVDENCDGDDGDQDGDGYWHADYDALVTAAGGTPLTVPTGWDGDCWDDPTSIPTSFAAVNGFEQPEAAEVYPEADDAWYDDVDQDCAGDDDFDQDGDRVATDAYPDRTGTTGTDCDDTDGSVFPEQFETWYDGTDDNCDGNDGDQDGDGYWAADYEAQVAAAGGTPLDVPADCGDSGSLPCDGDCDDESSDTHPDRLEDCRTSHDDDCDGETNFDTEEVPGVAADAISCTTYYLDADRDSYGSTTDWCLCEPQDSYDVFDNTDCDDGDDDTYPGADEYCDGHDDDCDGETDEDSALDTTVWYADTDGDGYGDPAVSDVECYVPSGYVADNTDCDDSRALTNPGATEYCNQTHDDDCDGDIDEADAPDADTWYRDADDDGFGDPADSQIACQVHQPAGYIADNTDCDDTDPGDYPGAPEIVANDDDEDCDGGDTCYEDLDLDTYGTSATVLSSDTDCSDGGESYTSDDCDDGDDDTYPAADEYCDGHDDDCDGEIDEDGSVDVLTWYADSDGDGYGDPSVDDIDCYQPTDYVADNTDCDDSDSGDYPGATEIVGNEDDESCDGTEVCFHDDDDDGWLDSSGDTIASSDVDCTDAYEGTDGDPTTDCDDSDSGDYPGAPEIVGNEDDESCDGTEVCFHDDDDDGWLDSSGDTIASSDVDCTDAYEGTDGDPTTDCDDSDSGDYPGAAEIVGNGDDEDCDGGEICFDDDDDDGYLDGTGDTRVSTDDDCKDAYEGGLTTPTTDCDDADPDAYPGATEYCDGHDDDCDGEVDEDASADVLTWYADSDGDGYGDPLVDDIDCYQPTDYVADATDCDDTDAGDHPGATETVGNQDDEDCDGGEICYWDKDDDTYLAASSGTIVSGDVDCTDPNEGTSSQPFTDCDDLDAGDHPGATETVGNEDDEDCDGGEICYEDDDDDGYLDTEGDTIVSLDTDCGDANEATASAPTTDCDDADAAQHPGADEYCNSEDDDCDGTTDEDDAVDAPTWYDDGDSDGFGDPADSKPACSQPTGHVADATDCDDSSSAIYPGATETVADGVDQSCSGGDSCYQDSDGDNYGSSTVIASVNLSCTDGGEADNDDDCDDGEASTHPGADEYCDGHDDDCDGTTDEDDAVDASTWYHDGDSDGFGDAADSTQACAAPAGHLADATDCDDADGSQNPDADEVCNGEDDDCDGTVDEDDAVDALTWYADSDTDGYGDALSFDYACTQPAGYVSDDSDCDDSDSGDHPGATEIVGNEDDEDCNGGEICFWDKDGDGYGTAATKTSTDDDCGDAAESTSDEDCDDVGVGADLVFPGATEGVGDGVDQNCDGAEMCYDDDDNDGQLDSSADTRSSTDTDCDDDFEGSSSTPTTDCDDSDPSVYLGADEYCGSVDHDCDGVAGDDEPGDTLDASTWYGDLDEDGFGDPAETLVACSQPSSYVADDTDCLDTSAEVYPEAPEFCEDGLINDCDAPGGGAAGNTCPSAGDLVISEVMPNPYVLSDTSGEWFEIYNTTGSDIELEGMMIYDLDPTSPESHRIVGSVVVPASGYALLARHADALREYDYVYSGFSLGNSGDELVVATWGTDGTDGVVIDEVSYTSSWPFASGYAMALDAGSMDASSNDTDTNWAEAVCAYNLNNAAAVTYDMGTPGGDNDLGCPVIDQLDPSEIDLAGGGAVTISGSDLEYAAADVVVTVGVWGADAELAPTGTSATEVDFTAPSSGSQGSEDVVIYNGINVAILEDALNWIDLEAAFIWWPIPAPTHASWGRDVQDDAGGALDAGDTTEVIYGRFYEPGLGNCTVEPAGMTVELGYGDAGTDPRYDGSWSWTSASWGYSGPGDCSGDYSEYNAQLTSLPAGTYDFTFRFSRSGGPWLYGELRVDASGTSGEASGYALGEILELSELGTFTVN